MNETVNIEGVTWGIDVVHKDKSEDVFIARHIDDIGTYTGKSVEKKLAVLKLVWKMCNPGAVQPTMEQTTPEPTKPMPLSQEKDKTKV